MLRKRRSAWRFAKDVLFGMLIYLSTCQPEEIADVAVFLASGDARYVHGTTTVVDGAHSLFPGQGA